jgi:hypothetical protein
VSAPRVRLIPNPSNSFCSSSYYLYSQRGGSLVRSQVSHAPYRFRKTDVEISSSLPAQLSGFTLPDHAAQACFVDGFDVQVYATRALD